MNYSILFATTPAPVPADEPARAAEKGQNAASAQEWNTNTTHEQTSPNKAEKREATTPAPTPTPTPTAAAPLRPPYDQRRYDPENYNIYCYVSAWDVTIMQDSKVLADFHSVEAIEEAAAVSVATIEGPHVIRIRIEAAAALRRYFEAFTPARVNQVAAALYDDELQARRRARDLYERHGLHYPERSRNGRGEAANKAFWRLFVERLCNCLYNTYNYEKGL